MHYRRRRRRRTLHVLACVRASVCVCTVHVLIFAYRNVGVSSPFHLFRRAAQCRATIRSRAHVRRRFNVIFRTLCTRISICHMPYVQSVYTENMYFPSKVHTPQPRRVPQIVRAHERTRCAAASTSAEHRVCVIPHTATTRWSYVVCAVGGGTTEYGLNVVCLKCNLCV